MNEINKKIIDAIIKKAESLCPDSLALIGLYGSVATGDIHEKSDLDLLILINDDRGWQLADGFILDDIGIGYDLYCTSWGMLEEDAQCGHAHISKLLDSPVIYVKDAKAVERLEMLREKAENILASDERYAKAYAAFEEAKKLYADCFLAENVAQIRTNTGGVIHFLLNAVMLCHGRYFKKGVKRTFEELKPLNLPFDMEGKVMAVIRAETAEGIRNALTDLMRCVRSCLPVKGERELPNRANLRGTYEEMFSNWRNKMQEAAERNDLFPSFMNMISFQSMINEIGENVAVDELEIMENFDPNYAARNLESFDTALSRYLQEYEKAGVQPRRFANVDAFLADYLKDSPA